jgi:hypothetical protein
MPCAVRMPDVDARCYAALRRLVGDVRPCRSVASAPSHNGPASSAGNEGDARMTHTTLPTVPNVRLYVEAGPARSSSCATAAA